MGLKDILTSERGILGILLILASTVLAALGHQTVDQWREYTTYIFGIYVAGKSATGVATVLANKGSPTPATSTTTPVVGPSGAGVAVTLVALLAIVSATGCANQRNQTIRATIVAVDAARDEFVTFDNTRQTEIASTAVSLEAGNAELDAYHKARKPVIDGFRVVYRALALAASATDDASLNSAVGQATKLVTAIQELRGAK